MELQDVLDWHKQMYKKYNKMYKHVPTASSGHMAHFHKSCVKAIEKSMGKCNESTED